MINITNACDQIIEIIKQSIITGEFKIGERIPTERNLSEKLKISRGPVREALRSLRQRGFLVTKHGIGTFVSEGRPTFLENEFGVFRVLQNKSIIELLQLRELLEVEAARMAAVNATALDVEKLSISEAVVREELTKLKREMDNSFCAANLKFHVAIAEASHNSIYVQFISSIHETMHLHQLLNMRDIPSEDEVIKYHRNICEAIAERNPKKAQFMMREYIKRVENIISIGMKKRSQLADEKYEYP